MSWTQRGLVAVLLGLGVLVVMDRMKGSTTPGDSNRESPIKGATFASAIPVYPGAKLRDIMGGDHYGELGGPVTFKSQSWFFEFKDPVAEVIEFYRKNLPEGAKPSEGEEGAVGFEWTPGNAVEGESVTVTVRKGELQIGETVKVR